MEHNVLEALAASGVIVTSMKCISLKRLLEQQCPVGLLAASEDSCSTNPTVTVLGREDVNFAKFVLARPIIPPFIPPDLHARGWQRTVKQTLKRPCVQR